LGRYIQPANTSVQESSIDLHGKQTENAGKTYNKQGIVKVIWQILANGLRSQWKVLNDRTKQ
jgi:hypothetical protein